MNSEKNLKIESTINEIKRQAAIKKGELIDIPPGMVVLDGKSLLDCFAEITEVILRKDAEISATKKEIVVLKAKLWIANDRGLRTYDGALDHEVGKMDDKYVGLNEADLYDEDHEQDFMTPEEFKVMMIDNVEDGINQAFRNAIRDFNNRTNSGGSDV